MQTITASCDVSTTTATFEFSGNVLDSLARSSDRLADVLAVAEFALYGFVFLGVVLVAVSLFKSFI